MVERDRTLDLVESAQRGDRGAFGELAELHRSRLLAFVRSRMGRGVRQVLEPEDVVQETFARSWELLARFQWRGQDSFFRWLSAIAGHLVLGASQKSARIPLALSGDEAADASAHGVAPSKAMRRDERFERLEQALQELPPAEREAIRLARIDGLPVREVAKRMKKSTDAVKKIITRALRRLQGSMGDTASLRLPARELDQDNSGKSGEESRGSDR